MCKSSFPLEFYTGQWFYGTTQCVQAQTTLWWRSRWRRRNTKRVSRNVRRILSSGRNSVNCEYTIITIVIVFVITIAIPIVYEHERMQKGTSKDASFVNLNSPATPPPITESPYLSSDESHWEVKTALAPLLWRQLKVISIFGDHRIWHQNMASWYGHQFSWEVHLLQHFKDGNQKNNASLVTAWNCVIFQICCKYPTKESMGINAILTSAWAVRLFGTTKYGKQCSFEGSWKLWGQLKTGQFLQHKALAVPSLTHCQV